ncbi:DUF397 domain-containing protein [Streptomyces xinghaiensis]|uniref:DUF397 domain-containing protein n=1 Tax=Streptomyces xinghaiensis TaxID=1038928 RepID=UPI003447D7B7
MTPGAWTAPSSLGRAHLDVARAVPGRRAGRPSAYATPATVRIRDSKNRQGPVLGISSGTWSAFVTFAGGRPRPEL